MTRTVAASHILFDLDGTPADSMPALYAAFCKFLDDYGIAGTKEAFDALNGPPLPEIIRVLKNTHELSAAEVRTFFVSQAEPPNMISGHAEFVARLGNITDLHGHLL